MLANAIVGLVAVIMSMGLVSVLFYGFCVHNNLKIYKDEIDNHYRMQGLRKRGERWRKRHEVDLDPIYSNPIGINLDGTEPDSEGGGDS